MKVRFVALAVAIAAALAGACSSGSGHNQSKSKSKSATHQLAGEFTLHQDGATFTPNTPCAGSAPHDAIKVGAPVDVTDADGKPLASGFLGQSTATSTTECRFPVQNVRLPDAPTYLVSVANQGNFTFTHDDMTQKNWRIEFGIG